MTIELREQGLAAHQPSPQQQRKRQIWLTVAVALFVLWISLPFLIPIAWAAILSMAEWPLFKRTLRRFPNRPGLIAAGFTVGTGLFLILPLFLLATSLAAESQVAIKWLQQAQQAGVPVPAWVAGLPLVGAHLAQWWQIHASSATGVGHLMSSVSIGSALSWASAIATEVATASGVFLITLILLAGMLASGNEIADYANRAAQSGLGNFGEDFLSKMTQAVRHTVSGTLLVSVLEGAIIGAAYMVLGVPQPLMFTIATIVLALVPFGAWLAFGLAGLILIGLGQTLSGVGVIAFGAVVMTIGDNLIQPAVVGGAVELPFLMVFIGAFGGLATLGLVGLFIGPVAMVALLVIWREWSATPRDGSQQA